MFVDSFKIVAFAAVDGFAVDDFNWQHPLSIILCLWIVFAAFNVSFVYLVVTHIWPDPIKNFLAKIYF